MAEYQVVDAAKLDRDLTTVADAIRAKAGTSEPLAFPDGMVEAVEGIRAGGGDDAFWDVYQEKGERGDYTEAFAGPWWTDEMFAPKYDMVPTGESRAMFSSSKITDLLGLCEKYGITVDFSQCQSNSGQFTNSTITRLGVLDFSKTSGNFAQTFQNCTALRSIEKIILAPNLTYYYTFHACHALESLTIEGTISKSGWTFEYSPLNKASLTSVVNCLDTTTSALTITFSKAAVNTAFETAAGAADGSTSAEWLALIGTRSNWTISLV